MIAQNSKERTEANVNDVVLVRACESCAERERAMGHVRLSCGWVRTWCVLRESPATQTSCLDALSRRMRPTQVDVAFAHVVPRMSETPVDSPTSISTEEATTRRWKMPAPRIPDLQQAAKRVLFYATRAFARLAWDCGHRARADEDRSSAHEDGLFAGGGASSRRCATSRQTISLARSPRPSRPRLRRAPCRRRSSRLARVEKRYGLRLP